MPRGSGGRGAQQHAHLGRRGHRPRRHHATRDSPVIGQAGGRVEGVGQILDDMDAGRLPLRDALAVPWMAVVHAPWVSWEGDVAWGYVIRPEDVPDGHLPEPGVTLYL